MDKIHTSANALMRAEATLKEFKDNISALILRYESSLQGQFGGIDPDYQKELLAYFDELQALKKRIVEFEAGNSTAIHDRLTRLSEYSAAAYKRRNIL